MCDFSSYGGVIGRGLYLCFLNEKNSITPSEATSDKDLTGVVWCCGMITAAESLGGQQGLVCDAKLISIGSYATGL